VREATSPAIRHHRPSIALLNNGKLVYMMERYQIEGRDAHQISVELKKAFDQFCQVPEQMATGG
jgi:putative YphP/YqiW family bacilliredoxin